MSAPILQIPLSKKEYLVTYTITPKNRYYNRLYEPIGNTLDLSKDPSYWLSPPVYTVEPVSYSQMIDAVGDTYYIFDLKPLTYNSEYRNSNDFEGTLGINGNILKNLNWIKLSSILNSSLHLTNSFNSKGHIEYLPGYGATKADQIVKISVLNGDNTITELETIANIHKTTGVLDDTWGPDVFSRNQDYTYTFINNSLKPILSFYTHIYGPSVDGQSYADFLAISITTLSISLTNNVGYTIRPFIGKYRTVKNQPNTPMSSYFSDPEVKAVTNGNGELFPSSGSTGKDGWGAPGGYMTDANKIDLPMSSFNPNTGGFNRLHVRYSHPVPVSPSAFSYGFYKLIPIVLDTFYIVSFYARSITNSYLWVNMNAATNFDGGSTSSHNNIALNNKWTLYTLKCKATSTTSSPLVFYANLLYTGGSYACDFEIANVSVKYKNNQDYTDECYQDIYTYTENVHLMTDSTDTTVIKKNEGQYLPYPNKNIVGTYTLNDSNGIFTGNSITTLTGYDSINNVPIPSTIIRS